MTRIDEKLKKRILPLNKAATPDKYSSVLYVMSRDMRIADNHALLAAQKHANALKVPLIVGFIAYNQASSGNRAAEQFEFMYKGLEEVAAALKDKNVSFVLRSGTAPKKLLEQLVDDSKAAAVYFDFSPLRGPRKLKDDVAKKSDIPMFVADTHNIVPVWVTSDKQEYAARTIRPKIHRNLDAYLEDPDTFRKHGYDNNLQLKSDDLRETLEKITKSVRSNGVTIPFEPGEKAADKTLKDFIYSKLSTYDEARNDPNADNLSDMSPYLHFGHIASLRVALEVSAAAESDKSLKAGADALIEEMVVRKELSDNFCYYNQDYDNIKGIADWAKKTLDKHRDDDREHTYTLKELEQAKTSDEAWNAAQRQILKTGKIHGYMRMYWAKRVGEWTNTPETAIRHLVYLNDFYHTDGGDPNGYVGILWSIGGLHDRPWGERPVTGQIRSMVYSGLKKKFDLQAYIDANS